MKYSLKDLVPGSKWIQSESGIVSEVLVSPYCLIYPCYGYTDVSKNYPITEPRYVEQPVNKMIHWTRSPKILKKYLSGVQDKYINKCTSCNVYSFLYSAQPFKS